MRKLPGAQKPLDPDPQAPRACRRSLTWSPCWKLAPISTPPLWEPEGMVFLYLFHAHLAKPIMGAWVGAVELLLSPGPG